jgi:hypothetical protein
MAYTEIVAGVFNLVTRAAYTSLVLVTGADVSVESLLTFLKKTGE